MDFKPTDEQEAAVEAFKSGSDLVIEAGAGTGKTSTLQLLADASRGRGFYIAYNRSIAQEAQRKFPARVVCKTAHSVAYAVVGKQYSHRLNGARVPAIVSAKIMGIKEPAKFGEIILSPQQLARIAIATINNFCYSGEDRIVRYHVPLLPGIDESGQAELENYIVPVAQRAWDEDITNVDGQLRFTHDYYLKMWALTRPQIPVDFIFLDEAQDSNGCVAELFAAQDAQRIAVGDRCQSIYGWRGALNYMENAPGKRLYLSQSFRFGQAIADEANKWLQLLEAPLRLRGHSDIDSRVGKVDEPDAILCRTNAGAMTQVVNALQNEVLPTLVGGGDEIRRFAEAADELMQRGSTTHPELMAFDSWAQVKKYVEEEEDGADLRVMVRLVDQYGPRGLIKFLDSLVSEDKADVTVSTAHKAKGREWDRVVLAEDFTSQLKKDEIPRGELMLAYVAVTRARHVLDCAALSEARDLIMEKVA